MSLLYVDIKNHQNIHPIRQTLESTHNKDVHREKKLIIDPQRIVLNYQSQKSLVEKLILQNNFSHKIVFKIQQPTKTIFSVKCKKSSLNPKESCQIFLFFAGSKQKNTIEDEFIINVDRQKLQLHIPITFKPKLFRLSSSNSRKLSLHKQSSSDILKQNEVLKLKIQKSISSSSKPLLLKKRKTGQFDVNCEVEHMISAFMKKFGSIHEFVKEKNVKKQIFIGEKALSDEKHRHITTFNQQIKKHIELRIKKRVESRLEVEYSEEGPIIRNFEGVILRWNKEKNLPRLVYEKGLAKVQEQVRKYLVNLRFQKIDRIFSLYRQFQKSNENNNLPIHKKHEIYIQKLQKRINKKSQISLQLAFDRSSIVPSKLETQNDVYSARKNHNFEINPRVGFDNWVAIEESIPYTHELMDYSKKQPIPQWLCHPKLQQSHLGSLTSLNTSPKSFLASSTGQKQTQQISSQLDLLMNELMIISRQTNPTKNQQLESESTERNTRSRIMLPSHGQIKLNQAYNITGKLFSTVFSIKDINPPPGNQHETENSHEAKKNKKKQAEIRQNLQIVERLKMVSNSFTQQRVFSPYLEDDIQNSFLQFQLKDDRKIKEHYQMFVINELGKPCYNMDYLKSISLSRQQQQQNSQQNSKRSIIFDIFPYKNTILRKVPKEDRYQFDRLDEKACKLLDLIDQNEKQQSLQNYRLKNQIDLQIPSKNKIKTNMGQSFNQQNLQNLNILKGQMLGKGNCLQAYLMQVAKNKSNATFFI